MNHIILLHTIIMPFYFKSYEDIIKKKLNYNKKKLICNYKKCKTNRYIYEKYCNKHIQILYNIKKN